MNRRLQIGLFGLSAIILMAAMLMYLSITIQDNATFRLRALMYLADGTLLFLPFWLLKPRLRWIALIPVWILAIFLLSNTLYYRYWGDLIPLSSVFTSANYNTFVFKSAPGLFHVSDLIFILTPTVITIGFFIIKPCRTTSIAIREKIIAVAASLILYMCGFGLAVNSFRNWHRSVGHPDVAYTDLAAEMFALKSSNCRFWHQNGFVTYLAAQIINYPHKHPIRLTAQQHDEIDDYLQSLHNGFNTDAVITDNKNKNLIFIIVESLNAWTIGATFGNHQLTPTLTSLAESDSCIVCLQMQTQINDGGSSDGQLIYNTGLFPITNGITANTYADNVFPSLAKALHPATSAEFIVEDAAIFNHRNTSKAFGYDTIYDEHALLAAGWNKSITGADDAVLQFAFNKIAEMPQPFFAEITTLSMHYPFDIQGFGRCEWIDSVSDNYWIRNYLQAVHYTDAAIGRFIDKIQNSTLADNTIIVIASDHNEPVDRTINSKPCEDPIVFIAINAGIGKKIDFPVGQIDVFPTILDIMGVGLNNDWRGVGNSMIGWHPSAAVGRSRQIIGRPTGQEEERMFRAYALSDTLIRANYWNCGP